MQRLVLRASCTVTHRRRIKIADDACKMTEEMKAIFKEMPGEKEELQQQIDELQGQAAAIQCANPRVMQVRAATSLLPR